MPEWGGQSKSVHIDKNAGIGWSTCPEFPLYLQAEEDFKTWVETQDEAYLDKMLGLYQRALDLDSTFARAYLGLMQIYGIKEPEFMVNDKAIDSTLALIEKALFYDDQLEDAYIWLAAIETFVKGNVEKGLAYANRGLEINPNYSDGYRFKGQLYYSQGDMVNAIFHYHKALQLNDDAFWTPSILSTIRQSYYITGFYERSRFYAEEKLKLDGDSIDFLFNAAVTEYAKGNWSEAMVIYMQIYASDSSQYLSLCEIMDMCVFLGENKNALIYAEIMDSLVVQNTWQQPNYAHRIGYAFLINGEKEKADFYFKKQIDNCQESIRLKDNYATRKWVYYDLAGVYAFLGDKEKAYEYLEEYNTKRFEQANMITLFSIDPLFDSIREEERFQKIYTEIKAKYQREHDKLKTWMEAEGII